MINRNLSTLDADLEAAIIAAKEAGLLKVSDRRWLDKVMQEQFDLPIRTIQPGCMSLHSTPIHTLVRDTVEFVRKEFTEAMGPEYFDKIHKLCYSLHGRLSFDRLWKQIDLISFSGKHYCSEYKFSGPCHMVVLIPADPTAEKVFLILDQYEPRDLSSAAAD